ncbi:Iota-carrageenase [Purpureocillium takamizusanense]|uniref:Iota-carrageenase n=1 Tax=Purpureocillium takamizusanense TaxID=2060973 RepID=A0A9Q8QLG9_9HYPO|nr:Iota-carrageenase [Purpureocillium takamizusanense]UNI23304.1 Iota-carrageenase [Purpureocillium takamizusanense]
MDASNGVCTIKPNWFDATQYGYVASETGTHATSIQAAIDSAAAAKGGTVFLPAGEYTLNEPLRIQSPGIAIVGAHRATSVTLSDTGSILVTASDTVIEGLEIVHDQPDPSVTSPWEPKPYQPAILVDGATRATLRNIVFVNATSAIDARNPRGLIISGIRGQPLQSGIRIESSDSAFDVSVRDVVFEPSWSKDRRVLAYQASNAVAFSSINNNLTKAAFEGVSASNYAVGFAMGGDGPPSSITRQSLSNARALFCGIGLAVGSNQVRLAVQDFIFLGLPGDQSVNGVLVGGSNITLHVIGFRCDTTGQAAISVDGPSPQLATFRNVFIKDWNQQANAALGLPAKKRLHPLKLPPQLDSIGIKVSGNDLAEEVTSAIYAGWGAYVEISGDKTFTQTPPANWPIKGGNVDKINIVPF